MTPGLDHHCRCHITSSTQFETHAEHHIQGILSASARQLMMSSQSNLLPNFAVNFPAVKQLSCNAQAIKYHSSQQNSNSPRNASEAFALKARSGRLKDVIKKKKIFFPNGCNATVGGCCQLWDRTKPQLPREELLQTSCLYVTQRGGGAYEAAATPISCQRLLFD